MKTKNNAQETVKSQVRKMVLRGSAVICSLVLISLTVSAQNFWRQLLDNNSGKMALLMTEESPEFEKADATFQAINSELTPSNINSSELVVFETEADNNLEVETWMTSETSFGSIAGSIARETDKTLNVEAWMTAENYFTTNSTLISEEKDGALNLEDWMISESDFNNQLVSIESDAEPTVRIEDWMTNENYFSTKSNVVTEESDQPLNLESWMLVNNSFSRGNVSVDKSIELEAWMINSNLWRF